ncbi:MAG: type II secretion system protein GspC [Pseudomonadota bacterium]
MQSTMPVANRTNQVAASAATVVLVALLGYALAMLAIGLLPANANTGSVEPILGKTSTAVRTGNAADRAAAASLFGEAKAEPVIAKVEPAREAPVTRLNLRLLGVLATDDTQPGYAVIAGGAGEQVLGVGDAVDSATLREIHASHVIIENRGALERLELPKLDLSVGVAASVAPTPQPGTPSVSNVNAGGGLVDVSTLPQTPGELRDYLVRNPATIQQLVSIGAHRENGKVVGYRLMPKQDSAILRNYGIEPGDVVTSLNGVRLDNQRRGLKALRQLVTASNIDMVVMRNGAEIPISIALQ